MDKTDNEKYNQILRTSRNLFWKHGIRRITIEEICREAEISKATFYKHLSNKTELVKKIIDWITHEAMTKYDSIMSQDIPFEEKIRQTVQLKMEGTSEMSDEFYNDYILHSDPELSVYLRAKMNEAIMAIIRDYTEAQKRGDIRRDIKPEFIMYFINHMLDMAEDEQLSVLYTHKRDLIMELTNFLFYGIMPKNHGR